MPTATKERHIPTVWKGPSEDGITYSLLCRFLVCGERFRLLTVLGLKPAPDFNHKIEYGSMWHVCEEAHAKGRSWGEKLLEYARELCRKYPWKQEAIDHWFSVCRVQFPIYADYWSQNPDVLN